MKSFWLATLGLGLGIGLGLLYAWVIAPSPVGYGNADPASLSAKYQAEYIQLVAQALAVDGNAQRAQDRLSKLGAGDLTPRVIALAQQLLAAGGDEATVRAVAHLATVLGAGPATATSAQAGLPTATLTATATASPSPTPSPSPTVTPLPTITPIPLPTLAPSPTPIGVLSLVDQQIACDPTATVALIQVLAVDELDRPVSGVEVWVEDAGGGFDRFFTGLKPERGVGYGDFVMMPNAVYTLRLAVNPSAAVKDLVIPECATAAGQKYAGSWVLTFRGE